MLYLDCTSWLFSSYQNFSPNHKTGWLLLMRKKWIEIAIFRNINKMMLPFMPQVSSFSLGMGRCCWKTYAPEDKLWSAEHWTLYSERQINVDEIKKNVFWWLSNSLELHLGKRMIISDSFKRNHRESWLSHQLTVPIWPARLHDRRQEI